MDKIGALKNSEMKRWQLEKIRAALRSTLNYLRRTIVRMEKQRMPVSNPLVDKELKRFVGHSMGFYSAIFSPDGRQVLTGSLDKTARLWDAATGKEVRRFAGHTEGIRSVAFSPDGRLIVTGTEAFDNSVGWKVIQEEMEVLSWRKSLTKSRSAR